MSERGVAILISLAAALTAGFVIGAEREQERQAQFGGVRTFPLIALAGALGSLVGVWLLVSLAIGFCALLAISYYRETQPGPDEDRGLSTEVAALTTFALGAFCAAPELGIPQTDRLLLAGGATTAVLGLLSFKKTLHGVVERISKNEVYAATKLLLLSVVLLPLLPDRDLGPWGALNPRSIGLLVVLISAIGFAGYVAIRAFGPRRGLGLTGLLGGLASSTAVTLTFAGRAKENPSLVTGCAVAIILASSTMFPRVALYLSAVSPSLGTMALWPFGVAGALGLVGGLVLYRRMPGETRTEAQPEEPMRLTNPFSLSSAFKFAALFTGVLVVSRAASEYLAAPGLYLSAVISGIADVDPITLSVARMHAQDHIETELALRVVGVACVTNTLTKIVLAAVLGGRALALRVGIALLIAIVAGAIVTIVI